MARAWLKQSERGNVFLIRLIVQITLKMGRPIGRLLLYPITLYFALFSRKARSASRQFLQRVLGHPVSFRHIFRHYHTFASTLLDRIYFLSGRMKRFDITVTGDEIVLQQLDKGHGCLLLGSHLGSFELLRCLATDRPDVQVKALMYKENAEKINDVLNALNPKLKQMIIPIGEPDSLFHVKDALDRGELVGILGDRVALDDKVVSCQFMGKSTDFPAGPMLLASLLKVPVVLFFGLYRGGHQYEVHFELLTEELNFRHSERHEMITEWTRRYAQRLEFYSRSAPYNWFNFYDYWNEQGDEE